jgi:hypothetical protein
MGRLSKCLVVLPWIVLSLFLAFAGYTSGICGNSTDAEERAFRIVQIGYLAGAIGSGGIAYWMLGK